MTATAERPRPSSSSHANSSEPPTAASPTTRDPLADPEQGLKVPSMAEILVLADHSGETVKKVTLELLTLARRFGEPAVVWTGPGAPEAQARLAEFGAAKIYVAAGAEFEDYVVAPTAELLAELAQQKAPAAVLLPGTAEGREVGARLAVKTGWGLLTDVIGLGDDLTAEQIIFGGGD